MIRPNPILFILPLAIIFSGCANITLAPSEKNIKEIQSINIIPVESPPLFLNPAPKAMLSAIASAAPNNTTGVNTINLPPVPSPLVATQIGGIFNAISAISDLRSEHPEVDKYLENVSKTAQSILIPQGQWAPMQFFADEIKRQLSGGQRLIYKHEDQHTLPGLQNRSITKWMMNWSDHTSNWYKGDIGIRTQDTSGEADLEFSVSCQFMGNYFLMDIMLKLIAPVTKQVIGRTRDYELIELSDSEMQKLFTDKGISYQQLFENTARKLIKEGLLKINLIQH